MELGKSSFDSMKGEVRRRAARLADLARPVAGPGLKPLLDRLEQESDDLTAANSVAVKRDLRGAQWDLRQQLEKQGAQAAPLREALEGFRNSLLDNTWEREQKGFPHQNYVISPPAGAIPNFSVEEPGLCRGGQPTQEGVGWLVSHHMAATEVDLRGDDRDNQWIAPEWANVKRYSIAVDDFKPPTFAQVEEFIRIVQDPASGPVFVHCKAGIGRTGVFVACLHVAEGMSADQAIARERINSYEGTLDQEDFVRAFEAHWKESRGSTARSAPG